MPKSKIVYLQELRAMELIHRLVKIQNEEFNCDSSVELAGVMEDIRELVNTTQDNRQNTVNQ